MGWLWWWVDVRVPVVVVVLVVGGGGLDTRRTPGYAASVLLGVLAGPAGGLLGGCRLPTSVLSL